MNITQATERKLGLPSSRGFAGLEGVARAVAAAGSAGGEGGLTHGGVAVACWICHGWMLGLLLPDPVESCSAAEGRGTARPRRRGYATWKEGCSGLVGGDWPSGGGGAADVVDRVVGGCGLRR